jgi:hypothetical protein
MILNKDCYERGCAAYDDRVDEGVVLTNGGEHMKAFPNMTGQTGMDLRDYFAAKAVHSFLIGAFIEGRDITYKDMAEEAYYMADAMMEAREHRD